jgi:hypothetical protein
MELIKSKLNKYQIQEKNTSKLQSFQSYCLEIIKEFGIDKTHAPIIFKYAKKNLSYLQGKVENLKETKNPKERVNCGGLLIYLLTKNK